MKLLFLLSTLLSIISAIYPKSITSSLISLYATKNRIVPLHRDTFGFYANIDLNSFASDASDSTPNPETVPVILSFYTNKTILTNKCLSFSSYNCTNPTCNPFSWTNITRVLPYFSVQAYEASALAYLDYKSWSLQDFAAIATSCSTKGISAYGKGKYGILGLGTGGSANKNYITSQQLSIYIDKEMKTGQLYFYHNSNMIQNGTANQKIGLSSDESWHIPGLNSQLRVNNYSYTVNFTVILDLYSDTIGLPLTMYQKLMSFFVQEKIYCSNAYIMPTCNYTGSIENLPNITLLIQKKTVHITPQIYVQNQTHNKNSITLNLRALSTNLTGNSYITNQYADYIILDVNFMSYYYVMFGTKQVTLNIAGPMPTPVPVPMDPSKYTGFYVLGGCLGLFIVLVVGGCCYFYNRKKLKKLKKAKIQERSSLQSEPLLNRSSRPMKV